MIATLNPSYKNIFEMETITKKSTYTEILERIARLNPDSKGLWGKMTPNQMLCHLSDPLRDILGVRQMNPLLPPKVQQQLKMVVFGEDDWAHNLQTFLPYSQDQDGAGTKPTGFEQDRKTLVELLTQFYNTPADYTFHPHAGLNILSRDEFGVYVWRHADYHLRQFGV
jgi:hypothetical protein